MPVVYLMIKIILLASLPLFLVAWVPAKKVPKLIFDVEFSEEQKEINQRLSSIEAAKARVDHYWQPDSSESVKVKVKKYESNQYFSNCARTYGKNQIYIHSIRSLKTLSADQKNKINPFCLKQSYDDLANTIIHEYAHILHLRAASNAPIKWIWEGLAVHLSDELNGKFGKLIESKLKNQMLPINICEKIFSEEEAYTFGASIIRCLEQKRPGIGKELASLNFPHEIGDVIKRHSLSCSLTVEELLAALNSQIKH